MKTDDLEPLILDLDLTCPFCAHRIPEAEIERVTPATVRCPQCRQVFSQD